MTSFAIPVSIAARGELGGGKIAALRAKLTDLEPAMRAAAGVVRSQVAREFSEQAWFSPGGRIPWKPRAPFGNRQPGIELTMQDSGAYLAALQGGPGGITEATGGRLRIGASGRVFPFAAALRGGSGGMISPEPIFIRPVKKAATKRRGWAAQWSMFWALGLKFGVWLRRETLERGLKLTPRPHMTDHPELRELLRGVLRRHLGVAA